MSIVLTAPPNPYVGDLLPFRAQILRMRLKAVNALPDVDGDACCWSLSEGTMNVRVDSPEIPPQFGRREVRAGFPYQRARRVR